MERLTIVERGYEDIEGELEIAPHEIEVLPTGEARFERLAKVVKQHSAATFAYSNPSGCLVMDVQTANVIVQVAGALNPTNRAKFLGMDLGAMATLAWKLVA